MSIIEAKTSRLSCRFSSLSCFRPLDFPTFEAAIHVLSIAKRPFQNSHPPDHFGHRRAVSACFGAKGICSFVDRNLLISSSLPEGFTRPEKGKQERDGKATSTV